MYTGDMANMEGVEDGGHMADEKSSQVKKIVQSSLFDSFSTLESYEENCRVDAGIALLRCLYQKQRSSEDESSCPEINYSLKRLIRGLATSNTCKRAGFFSVLVEMLKLFPCITSQDVLGILENEMTSGCNTSKKEITEVFSCQMLVYGALIHSKLIFKEPKSIQEDLLGKLLAVKEKKKTLFPYVCSFLIGFIQKTDAEHFQQVLWPVLKPELSKSLEELSIDSFHLLLIAKKQFPEVVDKKFLVTFFGSKNIIREDSVSSCSKLLVKNPIVENHPGYEVVSHYVCSLNLAVPFWESLVKENEQHPNQQKEEVLMNILGFLLQNMTDKSQIPELLRGNFMVTIIKTFQMKKLKPRAAQKATELFTKMSNLLSSNEVSDEVRISFIQHILFYPGNLMFDKLAGTRILLELSSHMKPEAIEKITKIFRDVINARRPKMKNSQGETCSWSRPEVIYAVQLYTRFLNHPIMEENIKWKLKQFKFLISYGLIASPSHELGDIMNSSVSVEIRNCLFKALDQKVSKDEQLITLLTLVVNHINGILFIQENPLKLRQPLSESSVAAWQKMISVVNEIERMNEKAVIKKRSEKSMFLILFLHMGLQLFHNASLAEEALQELHMCYEKTNNTNLKLENKKVRSANAEDEPYWVEVIVDLLLSLLSHSSHVLRNVVGVIFPHLCPHLTPASVHQILKVLDPHGKQPLSSTDTEGDDSEDETNKESSDNDDSEKESGSDDDLDDDTGNTPVDVHLKMAVHNALKKAGGGCSGSDEESIDMDQMTEEERNGLDAALSEAFKLLKHNQADQKRSNKKQSKDDETLMHFRVRVVDLLDSYLANQPALAVVLDIILPMFELLEFCIRDSHQKPLENRVRHCLKKLSSVKHFSNVEGVDQELVSVVLRRLLQKGERAAAVYQNMGGPLVQCSTFLARTSHYVGQQDTNSSISKHSPVVAIYEEALATFFLQRDSLLPLDVFKSVLGISWKGSWKLAEGILNFAFGTEIRPFRRHQALQLLAVFFSNSKLIIDASSKNLKKLRTMEEKLSENTINILKRVVEGKNSGSSADVKEIFIKELLRVLFAVRLAHNRCTKEGVSSVVDWETVGTMLSHYWEEMSVSTDTKFALKKLSNALQVNLIKKSVIPVKRKADDQRKQTNKESDSEGSEVIENGDGEKSSSDTGDKGYESGNDEKVEDEETKKRKRPKTNSSKGKAILKKQLKEVRLAAMAEGLNDSFSFADVDLSKFRELNNETETVMNAKKKKKHSRLMNGDSESGILSKKVKGKRKEIGETFPKHKKHKVSE